MLTFLALSLMAIAATGNVVSLSAGTAHQSATNGGPVCYADILFLLDASSSIGTAEYNVMKNFVKGIINHFNIAEDETRVGVITFNFGAKIEFHLDSYFNKDDILNAMDNLQDVRTGTATNRALEIAREWGFTEGNGSRTDPNVPNIAILITDGKSTRPDRTKIQQQLLKDTGAKIYAIGIANIHEEELRLIASDPVDKYFRYVEDFDGLEAILDDFRDVACDGPKPTPEEPQCEYAADILFLLDASSSIGPSDYDVMKDFVKGIIGHFDISRDRARVGVITFNFGAKVEFHLNAYFTRGGIFAAFDNLQDVRTGTATHKALEFARELGFTVDNGARDDLPDIAILITDGKSTRPSKTAIQQQRLKDEVGAKVFAIGIGSTDENELRLVASDPDSTYFHYVENFNGLKDILGEFKKLTCDEAIPPTTPPPTPPTTSPPTQCQHAADILFLLDASSSIGTGNYEVMKTFVRGIISHFNIAQDGARVGVITFNFGANFEFHLNSYFNKDDILDAMDHLQDVRTGTATHKALEYARELGFTAVNGARSELPDIAILITDGRSTQPAKTDIQQQRLKDTGATIFAIGIASVNIDELRLVASSPPERYVRYVKDFDGLETILDEFKETTCDEIDGRNHNHGSR